MCSNEILKKAVIELKSQGKLTPELDAKILLAHAIGRDKKIFFHERLKLDKKQTQYFQELIKSRIRGKPVSRIVGKRNFWNDDFFINDFTLDPRPESEILIEVSLNYFKNKLSKLQILDLGSGSGCIGLSILKEFPNSILVNVDTCKRAISQANFNAKNLGFCNKVKSINLNWFQNDWIKKIQIDLFGSKFKKKFDLIVCNPPYIKSSNLAKLQVEVRNFDPRLALDGGSDGCDSYRAIFRNVKQLLSKNGIIVVEIDYDLLAEMNKILKSNGFHVLKIYKDLSGFDRVLLIK